MFKLASMAFGRNGLPVTVCPTYTAAVRKECPPVSVSVIVNVSGVPTDFNLKYGVCIEKYAEAISSEVGNKILYIYIYLLK